MWQSSQRYRHYKENALEAVFLHFGEGDRILIFIGVVESQHDRLAGQIGARSEIRIELIGKDRMITAVCQHL